MSLKYSIIHKIKSDSSGEGVVLESAQPNTNSNRTHLELFGKLKRTFHIHAKKQYGYFDPDQGDTPLPKQLNGYYQKKVSFARMGQCIADCFKDQFDLIQSPEALEYYLWVVTEEVSTRNELYLFLLKHDETAQISGQLTVEESYGIHPEKLQYAAKIDIKEWLSDHTKTYLSFLSLKTSSPATVAFNNAIGFVEGINRAAQTEQFLNMVEQYANNLPDDKECRQRVVDYCLDQDRQGDPIEIQALSRHIDGEDPDAFMYYLADRLEEPPSELYTDRNSLKRYTRLYGRDQNISISFSTAMVGSKIIYDERSETLTIRSIPKSLKSQLRKYLEK